MNRAPQNVCRRWHIHGQVQGVGFRPFVYRLATGLGLSGHVRNRSGWVEVIAAGPEPQLTQFEQRLIAEAPPLARPQLAPGTLCAMPGEPGFRILDSDADTDNYTDNYTDATDIQVPADRHCCPECLHELEDPTDRRYHYPFINCTQCGPRYTVIEAMPYDRQRTTMTAFPLCSACQAEYDSADDRRFHAEPLACPACGPQLQFESGDRRIGNTPDALSATVDALRAGKVVAVKGVGGYHLMADAKNEAAVQRLRQRKQRPDKPFAVLFADDLKALEQAVIVDTTTLNALRDPARPILLLPRRPHNGLAGAVAPGVKDIGVMLPGSPLQALLSRAFGGPLIATSGNLSGEPVLTDRQEARERLSGIADAYLHHNRPIARPADDPVLRPVAGQLRAIRLGRGTAPVEWTLPHPVGEPVLAVGGHMKNTIALAWGRRLVLSPHIGDLESPRARAVFAQVITDLQRLYSVRPSRVLCDANPDYASSRWARDSGLPCQTIFHHHAHASALVGEQVAMHTAMDETGWLIFTWDGAGLGTDATLWGGEALLGKPGHWRRVASMRPFRLPGGERAARQPWRSAAALQWDTGGDWDAPSLVREAWAKDINCPATTSVGRLFDGAAALLGLCHAASYEGQAPMQLEALAARDIAAEPLPLHQDDEGIWRADWQPLLSRLSDDSLSTAERAGAFHTCLAETLVQQALHVQKNTPFVHVGLTGGVFQNRLLTEICHARLMAEGFNVALPRQLPANDGALAFGQIMEILYQHA
ncbi:carbamoyltransferase HypF [Mangrovitalea sediminis]|uniref:carbamoyltransferase HypF n=1 Tax=Mangrovitalea sediminis TaxID=1982043 RepID=UPI000BE61548|nr:carbamoyltransferase HypF [Mangrovitalea sediminis]